MKNGSIKGIELEINHFISDNLKIKFSGSYLKGESDKGEALADIPRNKLKLELDYDFGSGEKEISSVKLLSASISYQATRNIQLLVTANNLFNEKYFISADSKSTFAKERSVGFGFSWQL